MADDVADLKEKAERYRRLMASVADKRAKDVLSGLIAELEASIGAAEPPTTATQGHQEQPPETGGDSATGSGPDKPA